MNRRKPSRARPLEVKRSKQAAVADPEQDALFRASVADVTPLSDRNRARLDGPLPRPHVRKGRELETYGDELSDHLPYTRAPGEPLHFSRPGVQQQRVRQLGRGGAAIQDEIDLHGLTVSAARPLLAAFLNACARKGLRRVRIIHGKGLRSGSGEGILKGMVASWLTQRHDVLAFRQAPPTEGGSGAVLVLLRAVRA